MSKQRRPPKDHPRKPGRNLGGPWKVQKIDDAQEADTITWIAPDDSKITIWFPPGRDPLNVKTKDVLPGKTFSKTIPKNQQGTYPYSVYIHKDNEMAEGGSSPVMVIVE